MPCSNWRCRRCGWLLRHSVADGGNRQRLWKDGTYLDCWGGSFPVSNTEKIGRQIVWNNAIQFHASRLVWVETEFNSTFFQGGYDGKTQTFATPGIILSRIPLTHDAAGKPGRLLLTPGAGEQIALTHFSTYNHSPIYSARLRF